MKKLEYELVKAGVRLLESEAKDAAKAWRETLGDITPVQLAEALRKFTTTQDTLTVIGCPSVLLAGGTGIAAVPVSGESKCPACGRKLDADQQYIVIAADGRILCLDCLMAAARELYAAFGERLEDKQPKTWAELARWGKEADRQPGGY